MKAEGKVSTIIYRNEKNGYTVFVLDSEDDGYITAVGETCNIEEGDGFCVFLFESTQSAIL